MPKSEIKILRPTECNICGGEVEYIPNKQIYGKSYGSGFCYHCTNCGAYVGTHKPRPKDALGILAKPNTDVKIISINATKVNLPLLFLLTSLAFF